MESAADSQFTVKLKRGNSTDSFSPMHKAYLQHVLQKKKIFLIFFVLLL